jgi:hypothetical protein
VGPWPTSDREAPYDKIGEERKPFSDCADREVIVRLRRGRNVASSSLSDSSSSEDSEDVILAEKESGAIELRDGGLRICDLPGRGGERG